MLNIKSSKRYIVKLAFLTIPLVPVVSSCDEDFLTAEPELTVLEGNNFATPALVLAQVNGLYSSIKHGRFLGGRYQIYNDIRGEEFVNRTANNVTGYSIWNQTGGADEPYLTDIWSRGYLTINRTNLFLKGLAENPNSVPAETAKQYEGEAKFIRAMSYFYLVQMFAKPYVADNGASPGLPLRLQAETTSANNSLARSTVAQVYTQILKDLNEAETALPEKYSTGANNTTLNITRANKAAVIALKARVYLVMGRYADVITESDKIVSAAAPFTSPLAGAYAYKLESSLANNFSNYSTTTATANTNTEVILAAPFADLDAPGTQNQIGYYYNAGNIEFTLNTTTGIYADTQFRTEDVRKSALTATYTGLTAQPRILTKFSGTSPYTTWVPLIRYGEVLLNLAEAEARVGSEVRALALLLAVHHRSDPSWIYVPTGKQNLINTILTERRIELLGEGFRTNDVFRTQQPLLSRGAGSATVLASIPTTDPRYLLPIPTAEVLTNGAL